MIKKIKSNPVLIPFGIAGASIGLGILGEGIKPINSSIGENVAQAGQTASNFVAPAVNISMGGIIIKQLRRLKK